MRNLIFHPHSSFLCRRIVYKNIMRFKSFFFILLLSCCSCVACARILQNVTENNRFMMSAAAAAYCACGQQSYSRDEYAIYYFKFKLRICARHWFSQAKIVKFCSCEYFENVLFCFCINLLLYWAAHTYYCEIKMLNPRAR